MLRDFKFENGEFEVIDIQKTRLKKTKKRIIGILQRITNNSPRSLTGFPDYVITKVGEPVMVLERKCRDLRELTYQQGSWLKWFMEHGVSAFIYFWSTNKYACFGNLNKMLNEEDLSIVKEFRAKRLEEEIERERKREKRDKEKERWEMGSMLPRANVRGRPKICQAKQEQIIKLRKEGYSYRQIAEKLKISPMTAHRYHRYLKAYKPQTCNNNKEAKP